MLTDFKKFIMRGNVLDLAVAVIIGGAFGKIVSSLVNDIIMPVIGLILGGISFVDLRIIIKAATETTEEVAITYGQFFQNALDFIIIALAIFLMIRAITSRQKEAAAAPAPPPPPPPEVVLLTEIRNLLKQDRDTD